MSLLLKKTPASDIRNHVLPMIARALEANQQQIQVETYYTLSDAAHDLLSLI